MLTVVFLLSTIALVDFSVFTVALSDIAKVYALLSIALFYKLSYFVFTASFKHIMFSPIQDIKCCGFWFT